MQKNPYYNPMPQQNQGGWQFNPTPVDYPTSQSMGQNAIDARQKNQSNLDRLYSIQGLWDTLPQVPSFMGEMVSGGGGHLGGMAKDTWGSMMNMVSPASNAYAGDRDTEADILKQIIRQRGF